MRFIIENKNKCAKDHKLGGAIVPEYSMITFSVKKINFENIPLIRKSNLDESNHLIYEKDNS